MLFSRLVSIVLFSRIVFILFALGAIFVIPLDKAYIGFHLDPNAPYMMWIWANFDGEHFIKIAQRGYTGTNFPYFPLYPLLISLLTKPGLSPILAGITISSISFLASIFVIYKIALLDFKPKTALTTLILMLLFPLSFFYHSVYADSLFLFTTSLSFYFARKKNWLAAGVAGYFATLTRFTGIALIPALAVEWYLQARGRNSSKFTKGALPAILLTSAGLLTYMLFLQTNFGDPLLFQKAMVAWGQNQIVFPPIVLLRYLNIFWTVDKGIIVYWIAVLEFVSFILYFVLSFYVYKKIRKSYGVFMFIIITLVSFTGTLAGTPRYLLHLFPAFIGLAMLVNKKPRLLVVILLLFLILGFLLTGLFTRGYFVA